MVIHAKRWRFTRDMIADAPAHPGVYALWEIASRPVERAREIVRQLEIC